MTTKLPLGPLPKTVFCRVTVTMTDDLKEKLVRYAADYANAWGETVAVPKLIPHMLEAFIAGDRGFKRSVRNDADRL